MSDGKFSLPDGLSDCFSRGTWQVSIDGRGNLGQQREVQSFMVIGCTPCDALARAWLEWVDLNCKGDEDKEIFGPQIYAVSIQPGARVLT